MVVGGYAIFAPVSLGGSASYVIPDGTSMEPTLHSGDLVVLKEADRYAPGDVIAYRSRTLDRIVIHRIVGANDRTYLVRGDANGWIDPDRPSTADILGRSWLRIPGGGRVLGWIRQPVLAGLAAAFVVYLLWGGSGPRDRGGSISDGTATATR
jgi:signal peptidase I